MKKFILISIFSFIFAQFVSGQNPFITNYNFEDGLPTNHVNCVQKDKQGFLWFGSDAGIIRYDGTRFDHFTQKNGLTDNTTIRIKEDNEGRVWFLNYNGTVNYFYNNQLYNEKNAPFLGEIKTNFYFHSFFQDVDSTIYFYNSISEVYAVKNNKYIDYTKTESGTTIINISKHSNNNLLFWEKNRIVELSSLDKVERTYKLDFSIKKAFTQPNGLTYVCDLFGNIHIFKDASLIKRNHIQTSTNILNDIFIDNEYTWISSFDKGIFCFENDSLILHQDIDKTQNLILDNQNNIWTASNIYGIFKINRDILKYKTIGTDIFHSKGISDIAPSNGKGLWLTNGNNLFWMEGEKVNSRNLNVKGSILDNIYQLKNNTVILNGTSTRIHIIEDVKADNKTNTMERGTLNVLQYNVKKVVIDPSETYLYSFLNDYIIISYIKESFRTSFIKCSHGRVRNIFLNSKKELVVNSDNNFIFSPDTLYYKEVYKKFDSQSILSSIVLDEENEVLNIQGHELFLVNNNKSYNILKGLKNQIDFRIRKMAYDGTTLFFYTVKSIFFISNIKEIIEEKPVRLNRLNIEFNNINDIYCHNNKLHVASDDGLTFIPIEECVNALITPTTPYLSEVLLDDEEIDFHKEEISFKNKNRLSLEFSSLNFSSAPSNYAYMLEGVNNDWITGTEKQVVYLNLKPGEYTFKLKSRKNLEAYSEIIELPIKVIPTFFQLLVTKIVALLFFILTGFLILRDYYRRQIKSKEKDNQLVTLENRALQSMMNPHFIFNSLGSIQKFLLQNKAEEAGSYLSQFARLIRQTMNSIKSNHVLLDDEIDRLRNYIELEQLRMQNKFEYAIEMDDELQKDEYNIPSMIVQPFVENAIWHGISRLQAKGMVRIKFCYIDEKSLCVIVEDNGIGFEKTKAFAKSKNNLNMASTLTQKRMQLIGEKYHVKTEFKVDELYPETENPGAKISLILPIVN